MSGPALHAHEIIHVAARGEAVIACFRDHPSAPKPRFFTEKDAQLVLLHGALALGARILPVSGWAGLCRATAAPKRARHRRKQLAAFSHKVAAVLGTGGADPAALLDHCRARQHERHLTYLRERVRPDPVGFTFSGLEGLQASLAAGRGAILWVIPALADTIGTKRALASVGLRGVQLSVHSHGFSQSSFAVARVNPGQIAVENRYLAGRVKFAGKDTVNAKRRVLENLGQGRLVLFANTQFAGRAFLAVPFGAGYVLPLARTPLSIAVRRDVPIHMVTTLETDSFRHYHLRISSDLRSTAPADDNAPDAALRKSAAMALAARDILRDALQQAPGQIRLWDALVPAEDIRRG
ncbi:MAG: hypothetical protein WDA25_01365 [Paracoccaceae bacterium]